MARPVIEDEEEPSTSPNLIRGLLANSGDIVADSSDLARSLHRKQKWMSSVGLVMVLRGEVEKEACLLVAKMEHEEGMRVQATTVNGKRTYRAEYLKDLILGQGTKVFKVGIFAASGATESDQLRGHVVDVQQGGGGVAEYFVEFLGCKFTQRSDVQTEQFFKSTQSFISQSTKGDPRLLQSMRSRCSRRCRISQLGSPRNSSPNVTSRPNTEMSTSRKFKRRACRPGASPRTHTSSVAASGV